MVDAARRRALQSMTHIVTHAHHANLYLPTSVAFFMIHDKLLIGMWTMSLSCF